MPLSFKAPASSALVNATFVYKDTDDDKKGRLGLYKILPTDPDAVSDTQDYLNELAANLGQLGEGDANANVYATNNVISDGENRKEAIESLDAQMQINIDDIDNIEALIAAGAIKIKSYISDSAYITANGAPVGGEVYYNSTTGLIRYYNGIELEWDDVGSKSIGVQESPVGAVNGINTDYDITNAPLNEEAITVYVNGLIIPKSEWSYSAPTITLATAPTTGSDVYVFYISKGNPASPIVSAGVNNVVYHQVTAGEEAAKLFVLPSTPITPTKTLVDVVGGSTQEYNVDFTISGVSFDWDGLGLDGDLTAGDVVRIQFFN